ncbi:MAG: substrate-binding domain-containing protein [Kiritimatiellae bacterium]|nr:substrate-binding domain-containing protein [Kiritimatiellia bacterium]
MQRPVDDLALSVEQRLSRPLSLQLADGLRTGIQEGRVAVGDGLPTLSEWAAHLHCSTRVPREAYARLRAEGLVVQRPRCGTRVCLEGARVWNGHVMVLVVGEMAGFYRIAVVDTIARRLEARGVKVTRAVVPRISSRRCDLRRLRAYLNEKPDLVLHQTLVESVVREIASRVPLCSFAGSTRWLRTSRCVGCIDMAQDSAYSEFVDYLKKSGVSRVAVADFQRHEHSIYGMLKGAGIATDRWTFPPDRPNNVALIRQAAFDGVRSLVANPGFKFPRVVYFADDHVAQGALMAFSEMGVKVPRDVSVVSLCNAGDMPTSPVELARIEEDPVGIGERAADAALAYLKAKRSVGVPVVPTRFVPAASLAL